MARQREVGTYQTCSVSGESYRAFIPSPLPPKPALVMDAELTRLLERANRELGRLDGAADVLPDAKLLLYQYVRKEAVLSSQIEGTQSSLSDLLRYEIDEAPGAPTPPKSRAMSMRWTTDSPTCAAMLKADREAGRIVLDSETTLSGVPAAAWDYRLGNRSALEWVLDQYKEKTPKDPTIREKFNTCRFADYKDKVIDLLQRVTTVSVETQRIVQAMRGAD